MNNKGQSVMSEYVMIFFVVVAAAVAMTTFVQRSLEARVHDAKDFAIDAVINSGACDANCVLAAGGSISHEFEPYYTQMVSDVQQNSKDGTGATQGNTQILGAIYYKTSNEATTTVSTSSQLPSGCANVANPPWYCPNYQPPAAAHMPPSRVEVR